LGQNANGDRNPPTAPDAFNTFHTRLDHPGDGNAMGTYTERFVYDAVGNFLQMQHRGSDPAHPGWTRRYAYNETSLVEAGKQSNRLSSTQVGNGNAYSPEPYQHDGHGNMVRMPYLGGSLPGPNMHWDYKDQLRQTDRAANTVAFYVYDSSGERVRKVWEKAPGLTEERIYLGGFEVFRKHGGPIGANTATLERETLHVMEDKQRIALVEMRTQGYEPGVPQRLIRYQFGNHLGSASLELDERAQIISYEEHAPYGSTTYQAVRSQTETVKRYRYTGKERDNETGLNYHGARYYVPWLGKWLSTDPIGIKDGINVYCYCKSNPVVKLDTNGLEEEKISSSKELTLSLPELNLRAQGSVGSHGLQLEALKIESSGYSFSAASFNNRLHFGITTPSWRANASIAPPDPSSFHNQPLIYLNPIVPRWEVNLRWKGAIGFTGSVLAASERSAKFQTTGRLQLDTQFAGVDLRLQASTKVGRADATGDLQFNGFGNVLGVPLVYVWGNARMDASLLRSPDYSVSATLSLVPIAPIAYAKLTPSYQLYLGPLIGPLIAGPSGREMANSFSEHDGFGRSQGQISVLHPGAGLGAAYRTQTPLGSLHLSAGVFPYPSYIEPRPGNPALAAPLGSFVDSYLYSEPTSRPAQGPYIGIGMTLRE
jgi:RHS repeat-associated protein